MTDNKNENLCEVGDYGPCGQDGCSNTVKLVLGNSGDRWSKDAIASCRGPNLGFVCEFCMRKDFEEHWTIDDYTEKYFDGADNRSSETTGD